MSSTFCYRVSPYSEERVVGGHEHQEGGALWGPSLKTSYYRGVSDDRGSVGEPGQRQKSPTVPCGSGLSCTFSEMLSLMDFTTGLCCLPQLGQSARPALRVPRVTNSQGKKVSFFLQEIVLPGRETV